MALALDYPVIHPGPEQGILDIEYRDSGTQEVAFTYYAGKDAIEDVNAHFRRYRDAFAGIAGLELWVSNEKVL